MKKSLFQLVSVLAITMLFLSTGALNVQTAKASAQPAKTTTLLNADQWYTEGGKCDDGHDLKSLFENMTNGHEKGDDDCGDDGDDDNGNDSNSNGDNSNDSNTNDHNENDDDENSNDGPPCMELDNCPPPPTCEELGNCPPPPTCEELGNCPPPPTCEVLGNCPPVINEIEEEDAPKVKPKKVAAVIPVTGAQVCQTCCDNNVAIDIMDTPYFDFGVRYLFTINNVQWRVTLFEGPASDFEETVTSNDCFCGPEISIDPEIGQTITIVVVEENGTKHVSEISMLSAVDN